MTILEMTDRRLVQSIDLPFVKSAGPFLNRLNRENSHNVVKNQVV